MPTKNAKKSKYLITTAQHNAGAHGNFLKSLEAYANEYDAELLILPTFGQTKADDAPIRGLDDYRRVTKEEYLNNNIKISHFSVRPQTINPLTGLNRFAQKDISTIFASPKQRMKVIANGNTDLPKMLMTTGAITRPNYNLEHRVNQIAQRDHTYGALIVEIQDDNYYHVRQIKASTRGRFADFDKVYDGDKDPQYTNPAALVLGDLHHGDTDPIVREKNYELIGWLKPDRLVVHDLFNGHSVTHHDRGKIGTQTRNYRAGRSSLEQELRETAKELKNLDEAMEGREIIIPACNHHDFLSQYLNHGNFVNDKENSYIASKLFVAMLDGHDPVEYGMKMFEDFDENVQFLRRDEDYKYRGVQLAVHGDKGPNGSWRASSRALERAYGKSITAHSHTPEILRDTYVVGTSTHLRLPYTKGPSSWMHTHGILHKNGKVQLINIIDGKYRSE